MSTIALIAFVAAVVNGALGYGFSSIAVPLVLLTTAARSLNPAFVMLEIVLNASVLWLNREAAPRVGARAGFVLLGLVPGIAIGTAAFMRADLPTLKLATYLALLPVVLLQAAGFRHRVRSERSAGAALGAGVGALYAVTTISGPPLAMFFNNQGLTQRDFRAALALIRTVAALITAVFYANTGLITADSFAPLAALLAGALAGIPVGAWLIGYLREESFRRVCMAFDAAIIAFGISTLLRATGLVTGRVAFAPFVAVVIYDAVMLLRFFRTPSTRCPQPQLP